VRVLVSLVVDTAAPAGVGSAAAADVTPFGTDGFQSIRTGNGGTVTLEPVERTTYTVGVEKPGCLTDETELAITGDVARTIRIERSAVQLAFNVTDDHFDPPRPLESARACCWPVRATRCVAELCRALDCRPTTSPGDLTFGGADCGQ
jgi:hypothetical protein